MVNSGFLVLLIHTIVPVQHLVGAVSCNFHNHSIVNPALPEIGPKGFSKVIPDKPDLFEPAVSYSCFSTGIFSTSFSGGVRFIVDFNADSALIAFGG